MREIKSEWGISIKKPVYQYLVENFMVRGTSNSWYYSPYLGEYVYIGKAKRGWWVMAEQYHYGTNRYGIIIKVPCIVYAAFRCSDNELTIAIHNAFSALYGEYANDLKTFAEQTANAIINRDIDTLRNMSLTLPIYHQVAVNLYATKKFWWSQINI